MLNKDVTKLPRSADAYSRVVMARSPWFDDRNEGRELLLEHMW